MGAGFNRMTKIFIFLFFLTISPHLLAEDFDDQQTEDLKTFNYVYKLCAPLNSAQADFAASGAQIYETAKNGYLSIMALNGRDFPVAKSLRELTKSAGYEQALAKCFGTSQLDRTSFTTSLMADDVAGKALGVATWYGIYILYKRFGLSKWARLHPQFMKYSQVGLTALGVGGVGMQALELHQEIKREDELKAIVQKDPFVLLGREKNEEVYQKARTLAQDHLNEINAELANQKISPDRKSFLLSRKVQLENKLNEKL